MSYKFENEEKAGAILKRFGLDIKTAINAMLKRVVKEESVDFLIEDKTKSQYVTYTACVDEKMTKSKAIQAFKREGFELSSNITFASKNKGVDKYWANPNFDALDMDWYLILNDWSKQKMHLFMIPARSVNKSSLVCRADKPYQIDIQILYDDIDFTDDRSKISFSKFLKHTIEY